MNLGPPAWVFLGQASDQNSDFTADLRSAPQSGTPTPKETKPGAMPGDDGGGLDDEEDVGPAGPAAAECGPDESVQEVQGWARPFALKHGELLSEGEGFKGGVAATAEEDADDGEDGEDELGHKLTLVTRRNVAWPWQRLANASC